MRPRVVLWRVGLSLRSSASVSRSLFQPSRYAGRLVSSVVIFTFITGRLAGVGIAYKDLCITSRFRHMSCVICDFSTGFGPSGGRKRLVLLVISLISAGPRE